MVIPQLITQSCGFLLYIRILHQDENYHFLSVFHHRVCVCCVLTLLLADSYMSPSTLRAYATRFSILLSFRAAGSGVGKIAWTLHTHKHTQHCYWIPQIGCSLNDLFHPVCVHVCVYISQFVDEVVAQVLCDVLMPTLPHSCRRGCGYRTRTHRPRPSSVTDQTERERCLGCY